jgi:hypothetical protein
MELSIKALKNERQWQSTLGVSAKEFHYLLPLFSKCYEEKYKISLTEGLKNLGIEQAILPTYECCLFFLLFQLKNALIFDVLGLLFNTDGGTAQRNFERYLPLLEASLGHEKVLPAREFTTTEALHEFLKAEKDLICDGTEFPIERPADREKQKEAYSGKKKRM